jgi:hypothetical protein
MKYILSYLPYLEAFSIHNLKTRHAAVTRYLHNIGSIEMCTVMKASESIHKDEGKKGKFVPVL